jgi:hypothetical protein
MGPLSRILAAWGGQSQPGEVIFRGNISVPSNQRWPKRWTAGFPIGRLAVSSSGISLWAHSLATVLGPTFSAQREDLTVRKCDLGFVRRLKFLTANEYAYFWTYRRNEVLNLLEEYGYRVEK